MMIRRDDYLPIEAYGAIGNLHTVALVGKDGSIDWWPLPKLDSATVFAALLDHQRGGYYRLQPTRGEPHSQRYVGDSNVLETTFAADGGRLTVTDFMPLAGDLRGLSGDGRSNNQGDTHDNTAPPEIHRLLRAEGEVEVDLLWMPRFDYARAEVTLERTANGFVARGGEEPLSLEGLSEGEVITAEDGGPLLRARFVLRQGEQRALVTRWGERRGAALDSHAALKETVASWERWAHKDSTGDRAWAAPYGALVLRSELTLKLLSHADTGAIAAAATSSLPETLGGMRNWDYRFSWIRDAALTAQALFALGHAEEAHAFVSWAERAAAAHQAEGPVLRLMYGLHGETDLTEAELEHLAGYRGSRPVRIGNEASEQLQLDIYGELLSAAYEMLRMGDTLGPDIVAFLPSVADSACRNWQRPDDGIWEMRSGAQHYTYSKAMTWMALERAERMAQHYGLAGDTARWRETQENIRTEVLREGYNPEVGAFVQRYGGRDLDAANLLLPLMELLPFADPRVQGTIDRTMEQLMDNDLVYRYRMDDGLAGEEGAFVLCSFWLVDALALSGRVDEAHRIYEGLTARANHVGLYAEQIDPSSGLFLGNFPQAFSHLGLINSTLYLAYCEGRESPIPHPIGSKEHRQDA